MSSGFIYLWRDKKKNMFYLGSHMGTVNDGYTGSSEWFKNAISKRPADFKRRILETYDNITRNDLILRETIWLSLIDKHELGTKYYNFKRVGAGGNIVGDLSEEKQKQHKARSIAARQRGIENWRKENPDEVSRIARERRAKVKNPSGGRNFGETNGFYGKKHTKETRQRISDNRRGKTPNRSYEVTAETKLKISENSGNAVAINTPFGIFRSYAEFCKKYPITSDAALRIMMKNPNKLVSERQIQKSQLFNIEDLGKSYKELGWYLHEDI